MDDFQKFGRYTVVKMLGEGAMGKVFLAHDPVLERNVALKVISIDAMVDKAVRHDYLRRFSFEAKASAKLNHPSIVAVYDAGEENGLPWIAFEFVQGETLESLINRQGRLPIVRALAFARDIASALQHAHGWSIIHRDIKPSNILIENATGIAKLADFGIVKAPWAVMSHDEDTLGSPGYMSPEQYDGAELDERADLFCLGVVVYQMVAGTHPFLRDTMAATMFATCNNEYTPLRDIVEAVPPALDWVVRRCCAADRNKRLRSANELIEMLDKAGNPHVPDDRSTPQSGTRTHSAIQTAPTEKFSASNHVPVAPATGAAIIKKSIERSKLLSAYFVSRKAPEFKAAISVLFNRINFGVSPFLLKLSLPLRLKRTIVSAVAVFAAAFLAIVIIGIVAMGLLSIGGPSLPPADSLQGRLIHQCTAGLQENNRTLAEDAVDGLSTINSLHPLAEILIARVHIRNGMYDQAKAGLVRVEVSKGGKRAIRKELPLLLDDISRQLKAGPEPPELVDIVRYVLLAGKHPLVRSWVRSSSYWLRWNAADILRLSNVDVDMTSLFILDLSCRDNAQTRLQAIARLSTSDDRRALNALREAAQRGPSDPLVAQEARRVLERNRE
jgi:serine/threonine-protein kinase